MSNYPAWTDFDDPDAFHLNNLENFFSTDAGPTLLELQNPETGGIRQKSLAHSSSQAHDFSQAHDLSQAHHSSQAHDSSWAHDSFQGAERNWIPVTTPTDDFQNVPSINEIRETTPMIRHPQSSTDPSIPPISAQPTARTSSWHEILELITAPSTPLITPAYHISGGTFDDLLTNNLPINRPLPEPSTSFLAATSSLHQNPHSATASHDKDVLSTHVSPFNSPHASEPLLHASSSAPLHGPLPATEFIDTLTPVQQKTQKDLFFHPRHDDGDTEPPPKRHRMAQNLDAPTPHGIQSLSLPFKFWQKLHRPTVIISPENEEILNNLFSKLSAFFDNCNLSKESFTQKKHPKLPCCLVTVNTKNHVTLIRVYDKKQVSLVYPNLIEERMRYLLEWMQSHHQAFLEDLGEQAPPEAQRRLFEWLENEIFEPSNDRLPVVGFVTNSLKDPDIFSTSTYGWLQDQLVRYIQGEITKRAVDETVVQIIGFWYTNYQSKLWERRFRNSGTAYRKFIAYAVEKFWDAHAQRVQIQPLAFETI